MWTCRTRQQGTPALRRVRETQLCGSGSALLGVARGTRPHAGSGRCSHHLNHVPFLAARPPGRGKATPKFDSRMSEHKKTYNALGQRTLQRLSRLALGHDTPHGAREVREIRCTPQPVTSVPLVLVGGGGLPAPPPRPNCRVTNEDLVTKYFHTFEWKVPGRSAVAVGPSLRGVDQMSYE